MNRVCVLLIRLNLRELFEQYNSAVDLFLSAATQGRHSVAGIAQTRRDQLHREIKSLRHNEG